MTNDKWEPWRRIELWSLREAAYLLSGQLPRPEREFWEQHVNAETRVGHAYNALKAATMAGSLRFVQADAVDTLMHRRVFPAEVLAWARKQRMGIPAALSDRGAPSEQPATRHSLQGRRRDALTPLIEQLVRTAADPSDYASIWNSFLALADSAERPEPLLGAGEGEVRYRDDGGDPAFMKRDAFIKRLKRHADKRR